MNDKNLILKISKHPLIELLKKNRSITNNLIARLIVEELLSEGPKHREELKKAAEQGEDALEATWNSLGNAQNFPDVREEYKELKKELEKGTVGLFDKYKLLKTKINDVQSSDDLAALENEIKAILDSNLNDRVKEELRTLVAEKKKALGISSQDTTDKDVDSKPEKEKTSKAEKEKTPDAGTTQDGEGTDSKAEKEKTTQDGEGTEETEEENVNYKELVSASKEFIEDFYEKAFLNDQAKLLHAVIKSLQKYNEGEGRQRAAQGQRFQADQEQEAVTENKDPSILKNIQVDLKSFIKLTKRSKEVLKSFTNASEEGKIIGSSFKKKFMKMLDQLQNNITQLVAELSKLNPVQESEEKDDQESDWKKIQKGYNEASKALSNIIQFGSEKEDDAGMKNNIEIAYKTLVGISHLFPSINPFGKQSSQDFDAYTEQYNQAIEEIKSVIRDVLELSQGQGGAATLSNAVEALKKFSGQIQNIFDVKSKFADVVIQSNASAAEGQGTEAPDTKAEDGTSEKAIQIFLDKLIERDIIMFTYKLKLNNKKMSEGVMLTLAAILSGAAAGYLQFASRYGTNKAVDKLFAASIIKYLVEIEAVPNRDKWKTQIKNIWDGFDERLKETIIVDYRKKVFKEPKLTGKETQRIIDKYLINHPKNQEYLNSKKEKEPEEEGGLSDMIVPENEELIDYLYKVQDRDFSSNQEAEKEIKNIINNQEELETDEKKKMLLKRNLQMITKNQKKMQMTLLPQLIRCLVTGMMKKMKSLI